MIGKKNYTGDKTISSFWANIFASVVFLFVVALSGQYGNSLFWLTSVIMIGIAYLVALIPHRLRFWYYALIITGFSIPSVVSQLFLPGDEISAAGIIFLLAVFWLPLIRSTRQSVTA